MEDWSSAEANLFEEAIEKYGKDFNGIKKDFLPWKSMRNIIEYFFMWKTTDVSLLAVQHLLNRDTFFSCSLTCFDFSGTCSRKE